MDCKKEDGNGEDWMWQDGLYCHEKESSYDVSSCLWNEVSLNAEDCSYMLDETTTPVKACGDLAYHVNYEDNMNKEPEEWRETSSQLKRRRMLQFDSPVGDSPLCDQELSAFLKSDERENCLDEVLPLTTQWSIDFPGVSDSSYENLDQQSEEWFTECLNDTQMQFSPDDMNLCEAANVQIDISEFCNGPPELEASVAQKRATQTPRNVVFKGRKSFIRTPTKLPSSVAYPFAFIKPCGFQGDTTLKDINQRILTPPPLKPKQNHEDPAAYPMSAFSGKPVVGKTKIRTEGGKGSITIMRTKG